MLEPAYRDYMFAECIATDDPPPRYALALSSFEVSHPGAAFSLAASGELQLRVGGKQNECRCLN